jgi:hypothetical protein
VAPDGADLLSAKRLPNALPVLDGIPVEKHPAIGSDDLRGNRRRIVDHLLADAAEDEE